MWTTLSASACFKCHRYSFNLPSGSLHKCSCIHECEIWTKRSFSHNYLRKKAPQVFGFHMLDFRSRKHVTGNSRCTVRHPWRKHRAIRHPSGRHPVFTGKPLKPGLMHSKHTSLHKCAWWLSGPLFHSLLMLLRVICGLLNGPSGGDVSCFIRLGSPWTGSSHEARLFIAAQKSCRLLSLPPRLLRGRMGSAQTSSDVADILLSASLYLFEEAIVPRFWRILDQLFKRFSRSKSQDLKETCCRGCLIYCERKGLSFCFWCLFVWGRSDWL